MGPANASGNHDVRLSAGVAGLVNTLSRRESLQLNLPGEYRGPASRAYLYYNADHKHWVEPLKVTIRPKAP